MVKMKIKRAVSFVMATVLSLSAFMSIGTSTAFAASGEKTNVYMVDFPRDGDANYDGVWGHSNLTLKNGWHTGSSTHTNLKAIGSYSGNIAYCIEPGVSLSSGQSMNKYDENYFNNITANGVISGDEIRLFIGRILQYGYRGTISTSWRSQNESAANSIAHAYATQLLIWETVVGERDANFNHKAASGCSNVKDVINAKHPLRSKIMSYYNSMVSSVQKHTVVPSFCTKSSGSAKVNELEWNGSKYVATLTDSNGVLSNYAFKASISGVTFSTSGNKLTVSMDKAPSKEFTITAKYLMADEYLSGNVREKLITAKKSAEVYPEDYKINVEALEKVQPIDLTASEISVRLGATWLPQEVIQQFMFEFLDTPRYAQWNIKVHFSPYTGEWNIEGKSYDRSNVKAYSTYGTGRINAYKIIEETLNLKDVRIFDYIEDDEGRKKAVLNKKETAIAQAKQELIKQGFQDWIWADPERREKLTKMYNEKFNSIRPREYDGSHITFSGMNPEITLREHQRNAVAHILYGGNTLLAHAVGAGKTFEMVAASQESKRLGLCNKSLFVVPNHLTEQWAAEYLQLYPSANILVATKKDFETKNRKKFCGRIATGDYDAVIIGHSQFEKIPMSIERQRAILEQQLNELTEGIAELKRNRGENFSVKQLEKSRKSVKQKLQKLNDQSRKDDVVTFEELGVDRLFIDESHYYKNLYLYGIRTIGALAQTDPEFLRSVLGKNGVALWNYANGNDLSLVAKKDFVSPIKSVGHGITTVADLEKPEQVWPVFLELTQDIGHKLRVHGLSAEGVAIHIRDNTLCTRQWQTKIDLPTQSPMVLAKRAFQLFEARYGWYNPIRSVTIQAINLIPQDTPRQIGLFMDVEKQEKLERLEKCIETIRRRFGKDSIRNGVLYQDLQLPPEKVEITMPTGMVG